jgi:hypothetical protein
MSLVSASCSVDDTTRSSKPSPVTSPAPSELTAAPTGRPINCGVDERRSARPWRTDTAAPTLTARSRRPSRLKSPAARAEPKFGASGSPLGAPIRIADAASPEEEPKTIVTAP